MANFWKVVNEVIQKSDILLEIIDARMIDQTRNSEVEKKVLVLGKSLIYVINKADLVPKEILEKKKKQMHPCVFVSAMHHLGSKKLRDQIMIEASKMKHDFPLIRVGVIGYPNTGKSSIINMLRGKRSAPTSSFAGYTRGVQEIKVTNKITMFDTPGVFPFMEKDPLKHALIGSKNVQEIKDPLDVYYKLFDQLKEMKIDLLKNYGIIRTRRGLEDAEETLVEIALKRRKLKKGGEADIENMARDIIKDWQCGKIK